MTDKSILEVAKSQIIFYNEKNWAAAKDVLTPDIDYDEAATQRRITGVEEVLAAWKGWAKAFPDSKASFDKETVGGNTVVIELTWRGTHTGPLQLPARISPPRARRSSCAPARSSRSRAPRSRLSDTTSTWRRCCGSCRNVSRGRRKGLDG